MKKLPFRRIIVLSDQPDFFCRVSRLAPKSMAVERIERAVELEALAETISSQDILICFSSNVIVSKRILESLGGAYNIHAAPPNYPGRDPHHFAVYEGCTEYGATLHMMASSVDSGPIIACERFQVREGMRPPDLLEAANHAAIVLFDRYFEKLLSGPEGLTLSNEKWGSRKTTRADFEHLCRLTPDISRDEFERRWRACHSDRYDNLILTLHGRDFRLVSVDSAKRG